MDSYRHPSEAIAMLFTLIVVGGVLLLASVFTLFLAPLLVGLFIFMAYQASQAMHRNLMRQATQITSQTSPRLTSLAQECVQRLKPGAVQFFAARSNQLNAYTFGLSSPKVVVLYTSLFEILDPEEMKFIIGHELGHVALGHTWLNTLLGGMAGVPTGFGGAVLLTLAFRGWNRACEYSADRGGLLACGSLDKAISALVKVSTGEVRSQVELEQALRMIEKEDDSPLSLLSESLSTHPMVVKRIAELRRYAASIKFPNRTV
ncbi:MAG TPA: M48 family metallopeptidase [Anaerolineaceae bacterium]|nr:M48 family metallopeptidase [Anaerolineaceae bacterium]